MKGCVNFGRISAQKGTTVVEFSIAASVFFLILFSVIEFGRVMYTWNLLQESTRSAARVAVVSDRAAPDNDVTCRAEPTENILNAAQQFMPTLTKDNLDICYLKVDGTPAADTDEPYFVTASITSFSLKLLIPIPGLGTLVAPSFTTTQVAESLGREAGYKEVN